MGRRVTSCSAIASSVLPKDIVAVYSLLGANCTCRTHVIPMAGTTAMGPGCHPKIRQWAQLGRPMPARAWPGTVCELGNQAVSRLNTAIGHSSLKIGACYSQIRGQ